MIVMNTKRVVHVFNINAELLARLSNLKSDVIVDICNRVRYL